MSKNQKISSVSLFSRMGIIGLVGTILFLATGCSEPKVQHVVPEGSNREAIINNILTRRSIRKYTDQQVAQQQLDTIMQCAIFAPSASNQQPWEVRVVQNPAILKDINERWKKSNSLKDYGISDSEYNVLHHAPVLIVIAGDSKNPKSRIDIGIMMQTILLSAHGLGLGTCPIGMLIPTMNAPENHDIVKLLNLPAGYEVMGNIALGYPAENPEVPIRNSDKVKYIR